jgi:hypothetical protein
VTGASVARSFCRRLIQLIKDRVHPAYEYWGQSDPTREVIRKVSKEKNGGQGVPDLFWESEDQEVPQGTFAEEAG